MDLDLSQLTTQQLVYCGFLEEVQKRVNKTLIQRTEEHLIGEAVDSIQRKVPYMYLQKDYKLKYGKQEVEGAFTAIITTFNHNEQFNCDDVIIIDCDNKKSMPIGSCVAIETEKGFHYILPFDGKFDIEDERESDEKLDTLWNHPLQDDQYLRYTLEKGNWVQLTHNKVDKKLRKAIPLNPAWKDYCDEWNRLAVLAEKL